MSDRYARYQRLRIERPKERILRIVMDSPKRLNAADAVMHAELTNIWRDIDEDDNVSAVILTGKGRAFSAGGDFGMIEKMIEDSKALMRRMRSAGESISSARYFL